MSMKKLCVLLLLAAGAMWAAGFEGRWTAEVQARGGKKGGPATTQTVTLNLKSEGNQLTGTVSMPGKKRGSSLNIQDGKIDGERFSFTTVQRTKKGETKMTWSGSLSGDQLTGRYSREGGAGKGKGKRRGTAFNAKRA